MIANHSLREFLSIYTAVEIPIIQRDYAQGRLAPQKKERNRKEINRKGENFIKVLFTAMREERGLHMDIIYGSIETRDGDHPEEKNLYSTRWTAALDHAVAIALVSLSVGGEERRDCPPAPEIHLCYT
jgi:hypothetical protein